MFIQHLLLANTTQDAEGKYLPCLTQQNRIRPNNLTPGPLPFPESMACTAGAWGTSVLGMMCTQLTFTWGEGCLYPSPGASSGLPPASFPLSARLWSLGFGSRPAISKEIRKILGPSP